MASKTTYSKVRLRVIVLFLSLFLFVIFLTLTEFIFRLSGINEEYRKTAKDITFDLASEPDYHRFFKMRKNLDIESKFGYRLKTNSLGMRSPEVSVSPPKNGWRAICVGDSVTFGWGVRAEESFPQLLQQKLQKRYPNHEIQVLNAGMPAYSSYQGLVYCNRELIKLKPNLIVFCFGHNDTFKTPSTDKERVAQNKKLLNRINIFLSKLEIVTFFKRMVLYPKGNENTELKPFLSAKPRNNVQEFTHNLLEVVELCRQTHIDLIFMTQGTRGKQSPERASYNDAIRQATYDNDVVLIDVDPILTETTHFVDVAHPNPTGHGIIADLLYQTIMEKQLVSF